MSLTKEETEMPSARSVLKLNPEEHREVQESMQRIYHLVDHFCSNFKLKDALSGLRQFLVTENPLKIMKNAFYFTFKALFNISTIQFNLGS